MKNYLREFFFFFCDLARYELNWDFSFRDKVIEEMKNQNVYHGDFFVVLIRVTRQKFRYKNKRMGWEIGVMCPSSYHHVTLCSES